MKHFTPDFGKHSNRVCRLKNEQPLRTEEHGGKDKQLWIYKHSATTKHPCAKDEDFEILASNYPDRRRRKLAEAMYIRDLKPSLNQQKESYKLALFN